MTAERFDAQIAKKIGLLSEVVDIENLDTQLSQLIDLLLANGPDAVKAAKKLVSDVSGKAISKELIDHTCEVIAGIRVSEQGQDGLNAFLDKRKPNWLKD
jgi:methylglutaconyl-CoA hydratase